MGMGAAANDENKKRKERSEQEQKQKEIRLKIKWNKLQGEAIAERQELISEAREFSEDLLEDLIYLTSHNGNLNSREKMSIVHMITLAKSVNQGPTEEEKMAILWSQRMIEQSSSSAPPSYPASAPGQKQEATQEQKMMDAWNQFILKQANTAIAPSYPASAPLQKQEETQEQKMTAMWNQSILAQANSSSPSPLQKLDLRGEWDKISGEAFGGRLYLMLLAREVDATLLDHWSDQIMMHTTLDITAKWRILDALKTVQESDHPASLLAQPLE